MSQSKTTSPVSSYNAPEPQIFDIAELLAALWRRKWWVIIPMLSLAALSIAVAMSIPPRYVAETQILIDPRGLNIIDKDITPTASNNESLTPIIESQMRVMVSDRVLLKVIAREGLDKDPEFIKDRSDIIAKAKRFVLSFFTKPKTKSNPEITALRILTKDVGVERPRTTYVVNLYVATRSAEKSARIANAIADIYASSEFTTRQSLSQRATVSLKKRLGQLRKSVQSAEQKVVVYREKNNIVGASGQLVNEQQLTQLNTNLIIQQGQTAKAKARFEQIADLRRRAVPPDAIAEAMGSTALRQLQQRLAIALNAQAPLEAQLGSQHPRLKRARARTASVRRLLKQEMRRIEQSARLDYERAQVDERSLQARKDQLTKTVLVTNAAQVQMRELEREAQASRGVYETFLNRSREIEEQKAVDQSMARVLSPALPPSSKSGPRLILLLAAGLIGGLVFGGILALLRDQLDQKIYSPKRLRETISVPVLTEFGKLSPLVLSVSDAVRNLPREADHIGHSPSGMDTTAGMSLDVQRIVDGDIGSKAGALLRQLDGQSRSGDVRTVMLHSASDDGEGTTGVALAMALKAANSGDAVLLVDGERSERRLSHIFGRDNSAGLVEVLRGVLGAQIAVQSVPEVGIWLLPAGRQTYSQIKSTARRNEWPVHFADAGGYDLVIIDGGTSMNATQRLLTNEADDIVLVVHRGASTYSDVENTGWLLKEHWSRVRGTVLLENETRANIKPVTLSAPSDIPAGQQGRSLDLLGRAPKTAPVTPSTSSRRPAPVKKASSQTRSSTRHPGSRKAALRSSTAGQLVSALTTSRLAATRLPPTSTPPQSSTATGRATTRPAAARQPTARQPALRQSSPGSATPKPAKPRRATPIGLVAKPDAVKSSAGERSTLSSAHVINGHNALPTLANIPVLLAPALRSDQHQASKSGPRLAKTQQRSNAGFGDMMAALADKTPGNTSPFRKAIAKLLLKIRTQTSKGKPHIVSLVAGHTGAGTSSTALSLAYAAALSGQRTLLVDAYSPDADLSTTFVDELGLESPGSFKDKDYLKKISIKDNITGLTFLPIALAHLDKFKQKQRENLATGISLLSKDYDLVIIDGGSILDGSSPSELTALANQVLIVACPGITLQDTIEATELVLGPARERVTGLVMAHAKVG